MSFCDARTHARHQVVEDLNKHYSKGLFDADVVAQLEVHMHLLSLYTTEVMIAAV